MSDDPLDRFEQQLDSLQVPSAPSSLRDLVLGDVRRELRAARWDRRLARTAAVLLVIGVGLNAALVLGSRGSSHSNTGHIAHERSQNAILETAVVVAEATNAETGSQFARHLAALSGRTLTGDEVAAIDAALEEHSHHAPLNGEG